MAIDTVVGYDATGGGVLAAVPPTSFTIKENGYIVGYWYDGISAEEVTITNAGNSDWPAAGFSLPATSDGTAVGAGKPWMPLRHRIPVKKADVLTLTATSGANPVHAGLFIDYGGFAVPSPLEGQGYLWTRSTTALGTNCSAGTFVGPTATGNMTAWGDRTWELVAVDADGAFTTTAIVGLRKQGGPNLLYAQPVGLTDVANDVRGYGVPRGLGWTLSGNDVLEVLALSVTAEQPTFKLTFATK